jgi:hypothetical protein
VRKPSFVVGLGGRYTMKIFKELGLPETDFDRIVGECDKRDMNLGAWVGPKEEVSAEPLSGKETDSFASELAVRCGLVAKLLQRTAEAQMKTSWGFKILGDIIHMREYRSAFPNARFILVIRDPRDNALSIMGLNKQREERKQPNFYDDYERAACGWVETIGGARNKAAELNIPLIEVKYEELVSNPEPEIRKLSERLDLDLSGGSQFFRQKFVDDHVSRFKHHDNLKRPINDESVGRWRGQMQPKEADIFTARAGSLMAELGYT